MKKTFLLVTLAVSAVGVFGQSQRLVFIEEFTQASCGPCAAANPAFNTLLSANTTKAVSVKYQTSWPGVDPMNAQNPTEVATRVSYYGTSGVPEAHQDGGAGGAPSAITQAGINTEYAAPSPFAIVLTHWFNAANDSIFINCEVTASQSTTLTTGKLRIAMVEKTITFTTAPGSNGETVFYNVMRKMYPNAGGTTMAGTWTSGQKMTISFKAKVPTYIYSKPQIAMVAWIQDDATKNVKQAAFSSTASAPLALAPVADFSANVVSSCDGIIKFTDNSALFPTGWSWDFGDAATSALQNPTHKYNSNGTYTVKLTATNANGNNQATKTSYVTVALSGSAPTGVNDNICTSGVANLSATPAGSGALNWYNSSGAMVHTGTTYAPTITGTTNFWVAEMTANAVKSEGPATNTAVGAGATFTATVTHGLYFDVLKPCTLKSVVCYASAAGAHTIQVVDAAGNIIQTASPNIPSGTSTVNLNFTLPAGTGFLLQTPNSLNLYRNTAGAAYPYNTSGVVSITGATAAGGYYYFFYNWQVQQDPCASPGVMVSGIDSCSTTGIENLSVENLLNVFPNPSNGAFNVSFSALLNDNYTVSISNTLGQVVYNETLNSFSGDYAKQMDVAKYGKGVYLLTISGSKNNAVKKVITY